MKKPNFFIIGAPKCGTTSMAVWLSEHPRIFMPSYKEPHFFSQDILFHKKRWDGRDINTYESLFTNANDNHIAVGEASTNYLCSESAIPKILHYSPEAKFIVLLRNPIDMAPSLHEQIFLNLIEIEKDFEIAWSLQESRAKDKSIVNACPDPFLLQYGEWCRLGTQIERLFSRVCKKRCLVLFLSDIKEAPGEAYRSVLDFLDVPDDGRDIFPVKNAAKEHRSRGLAAMLRFVRDIKLKLGFHPAQSLAFGLMDKISTINTKKCVRSSLSLQMRKELIDYFHPEVKKLERILGRDLKEWLQ